MRSWLQGKKINLGMILGGLLTTLYGIDSGTHPDPETMWITMTWYTMIAGWIAAWTGYGVSDRWNRPKS